MYFWQERKVKPIITNPKSEILKTTPKHGDESQTITKQTIGNTNVQELFRTPQFKMERKSKHMNANLKAK